MSPTQLSLEALRRDGWLVDVCERWIPNPAYPGGGVRRDLFGFLDLVALRGDETLGVQTTMASDFNARVNKIMDDDHRDALVALQGAGWRIVVHGWAKTYANTIANREAKKVGQLCNHKAACGCRWTIHRQAVIER